jgi:phospholipid/cholesterol/gamma-HCH transport system substrate-binding protein
MERLLDSGSALLRESNAFFTDNEKAYLKALGLSVTMVDVLYDGREGLRDSLLETGNISRNLLTVLEDGYARVEGVVYSAGAPEYTRADCPRYGSAKGDNCD